MSADIDRTIAETRQVLSSVENAIADGLAVQRRLYNISVPASFPSGVRTDLDRAAEHVADEVGQLQAIEKRLGDRMAKLQREKSQGPSVGQRIGRRVGRAISGAGSRLQALETDTERLNVVFAATAPRADSIRRALQSRGLEPVSVVSGNKTVLVEFRGWRQRSEMVREAIEDNLGVRIVRIDEMT